MTAELSHNDIGRAVDLDHAHVAWSKLPLVRRPTFGSFAVDYLRERGYEVRPRPIPAPPTAEALGLPASPYTDQALAMTVEDIADLLAALDEHDLHWAPGRGGEGGTLHEGQAEPPDGHVVFDAMRAAWQRDDARATAEKLGDYRWFGSTGLARMWADLRRDLGPLTPDGGIPPTTPDQETP